MKGIILAGGAGTRLYPLTKVASKQLLPVYDKPMIYYPLSTLMLAKIRDILIISTPEDTPRFQTLLGDGSQYGLKISYAIQLAPNGLAEALIIGEEFIKDDSVAMVLGDNIFYGNSFSKYLEKCSEAASNGIATVFGYHVNDPQRFGIVEFDSDGQVISVEEKPEHPKSNYAITGLYFYPQGVSEMAKRVKPSKRGELEITSLNELYLKEKKLKVELLGRGFAWLDKGTIESLLKASNFIAMVEEQQGVMISAPEEIAYRFGWISKEQFTLAIKSYGKSHYSEHLQSVANGTFISSVR